ncbi:MAG: YciI family protein [Chloroflexi bacterium]|nr:MAG: YciI family protein [Chloroflexota bacterium]
MFLLYWNENDSPATPEEMIREHFAFTDQARARGAYVSSEAIGGTVAATTVRVRDGKTMITDGPFAEAKEVMGGFYILDCKDLDEALDFAARIPDARSAGVEVRPVMHVPGWDYGPTAEYSRQAMA